MGILDHKKTWRFETSATGDACVDAFCKAMTDKPALSLFLARWTISRQGGAAVATYQGRGGVLKVTTAISRHATAEETAAVGSQLTFQVEVGNGTGARTSCSMWLSRAGSYLLFFTPDARFIRSHMHEVERRLRQVDPGLGVAKA